MKKILVTGACGYLGARISKYLAENGYRVTALCHHSPPSNQNWSSLLENVIVDDIRKESTISKVIADNFDIVIHLVSLDPHSSEDNPNFVSSINVSPTWNLLDNLKNTSLEKFIYFSTIHVYGEATKGIITEQFKQSPKNAYSLTNQLSEEICNYFHNKTDINCINIRLSNTYGSPVFNNNYCWRLVINDFCKTAFLENKVKILSDGSVQGDFIHIEDVCRAIHLLIELDSDNLKHNIYNLGFGRTYNIFGLAQIVSRIYQETYGKESPIFLGNRKVPNNFDIQLSDEMFFYNCNRICSLGFVPSVTLEDGVIELFKYLESYYG